MLLQGRDSERQPIYHYTVNVKSLRFVCVNSHVTEKATSLTQIPASHLSTMPGRY